LGRVAWPGVRTETTTGRRKAAGSNGKMDAKRYAVKLTGESPLLMHWDNLTWAERMKEWSLEPGNRKNSVAGDDRSPAFRWIGNLYVDQGLVVLPADNLMTMLREGGAKCPTGKGQKTFKSQTQSGMVVDQAAWPVVVKGKTIPAGPFVEGLATEEEFGKHEQAAKDHGFELFVKRAKVGQAKHVRVRPRFDSWEVEGSITVFDSMISRDVLENILTFAGFYSGLGDWRPSSPKSPGPYGKFSAKVEVLA